MMDAKQKNLLIYNVLRERQQEVARNLIEAEADFASALKGYELWEKNQEFGGGRYFNPYRTDEAEMRRAKARQAVAEANELVDYFVQTFFNGVKPHH